MGLLAFEGSLLVMVRKVTRGGKGKQDLPTAAEIAFLRSNRGDSRAVHLHSSIPVRGKGRRRR